MAYIWISCKFQSSCGPVESINNGHVHTTDHKCWAVRGTNCYISQRTWPLTIQIRNCWSCSHDVSMYMGTDLEIQSLRTINNPAYQRRSLKVPAKLHYTKYPLLISINYPNSSPDAPNRFVVLKKKIVGIFSKLKATCN